MMIASPLVLIFLVVCIYSATNHSTCAIRICRKDPKRRLIDQLGSAFDGNVMSVHRPNQMGETHKDILNDQKQQRTDDWSDSFTSSGRPSTLTRFQQRRQQAEITYRRRQLIEPEVFNEKSTVRLKRDSLTFPQLAGERLAPMRLPWHCETTSFWKDLGPRYFPRYLKSSDCASSDDKEAMCWYGYYACVPLKHTVTVLKRTAAKCDRFVDKGVGSPAIDQWDFEVITHSVGCQCSSRQ